MSAQSELDRIILELLGKEEYIGSKESIVVYNDEEAIVRIDLSDLSLETLPDGFFDNFTELRELNLSYNTLRGLNPDLFTQLTNLRKLDLSFCLDPTGFDMDEPVTLSSELLKNNSELRSLNLSGNQLEILPDDFFAELYNLEVLDLSYNLLAILPPSIGTLVNLETLILESNFLPIEFGNEYHGYMEVQEFLEPFQQEWMAVHESPMMPEQTVEKEKDQEQMEEELKKAFDTLEDMF